MAKTISRARTPGTPSQTAAPAETPSGGGYPSGGGGSRGGGGGGGSAGMSKDAKQELQLSAYNLGGIYDNKAKQLEDDTADKLGNIDQQMKANNALLKKNQVAIMKQSNWQPQQQKEQSAEAALRTRMGNAAYGSGIRDLYEGMSRYDDMQDVELINTYKTNLNSAYNNWYQANSDLTMDYNTAVDEAESNMNDLKFQYQAALNNLSPGAAELRNIEAASKQGLDLKNAEQRNEDALKAYEDTYNPYKQAEKKRDAAIKAYNKAKTTANKTTKTEAESAYTKAKNARDKAKASYDSAHSAWETANKTYKDRKLVNAGIGDKKINLASAVVEPTDRFKALMASKKTNASAVNPLTRGYFRPSSHDYRHDLETSNVLKSNKTKKQKYNNAGLTNRSTQMNSGFGANVTGYRRF